MAQPQLGQLARVDLRDIWTRESEEFTPWLAKPDNLKLLGDTIDVELELEAQEKDVGPFRADILCKDTGSGNWVLIENQLERTDHTHLGQLMTYAAGLKAVTIVWIAAEFTEEHRAAMDWLNEVTDERINFFGLEIELWRIGESPVAPKFNVVCKPNDWSKTVAEGAVQSEELSERRQTQLAFWMQFRDYVKQQHSDLKPSKPQPQHWINIALGRSGFRLAAVASFWDSVAGTYQSNELRAEMVIESVNSKAHFAALAAMKSEIEAELKESLTWYDPPGKRMCRIYLRKPVDLGKKEDWPQYHAWLLEKLEGFHKSFAPRVKKLDVDELEPEDEDHA